ncbi:MAG: hypothetical protein KGS49_12390 [Planctomycetes bacterium]|nr:hypothetical protein [Planctomycetota bacterium]
MPRCEVLSGHSDTSAHRWLHSEQFDCLWIANVYWPLLLLVVAILGAGSTIDFWQLYFISAPHRWLTLLLVSIDQDRRSGIGGKLVVSTILLATLLIVVRFQSGLLLCLGVLDYIWNAWHFASQHSGILSVYNKRSGQKLGLLDDRLQRWGVRFFIFYVILRSASSTLYSGWFIDLPWFPWWLCDLGMLFIPVLLCVRKIAYVRSSDLPGTIYAVSFSSLYAGYLLSNLFGTWSMILGFATAASIFHSIEYMAFVSQSYNRNRTKSLGMTAVTLLQRHWYGILALLILAVGWIGWTAQASRPWIAETWQTLNLWAALTHYAWDGMIWKSRHQR